MPDKNSSMAISVFGKNIICKNFSGSPMTYNPKGDRNFALIIDDKILKRALEAKGCSFKKLKDSGTDFVKIKIPKDVAISTNIYVNCSSNNLFEILDRTDITSAILELIFHKVIVNGKEYTSIWLKTAKFNVKAGAQNCEIHLRWPNVIKNAEETKMEKMTRAEVMGQLQMGIAAFEMQEKETLRRDPIVAKLMLAMRNAIEYVGEVPKSETKVKTVTVKEPVFALPEIKQVIFNYPATVVIWADDVKTVVECQKGDNYSMESGLAMCIAKRMMGNKSNFNKQIRKYTENIKNVQTKKKPKEGTFKERKAARMAQAEANKTAKGKFKAEKKKILDETRKGRSAPAVVNTDKMVVITEAYAECVRKKMAKRGWDYSKTAEAVGISQSALSRMFSPFVFSHKPKRMRIENFKKINKALGIRWKIEE